MFFRYWRNFIDTRIKYLFSPLGLLCHLPRGLSHLECHLHQEHQIFWEHQGTIQRKKVQFLMCQRGVWPNIQIYDYYIYLSIINKINSIRTVLQINDFVLFRIVVLQHVYIDNLVCALEPCHYCLGRHLDLVSIFVLNFFFQLGKEVAMQSDSEDDVRETDLGSRR